MACGGCGNKVITWPAYHVEHTGKGTRKGVIKASLPESRESPVVPEQTEETSSAPSNPVDGASGPSQSTDE